MAVQGYVTSTTDGGLVEQGITLLVGELVHQRSQNMQRRLAEAQHALGEKAPPTLYEKAKQLGERARRRVKTAEEAQTLLADMVAAQREEAALYKGHHELEKKLSEEPALGGDFVAVPLALVHGLEPVVEGRAYIGTRAEIDHAIKALDDTGLRPERVESVQGTRKYRVGDRTIEFRERDATHTRDVSTTSDGVSGHEAQSQPHTLQLAGPVANWHEARLRMLAGEVPSAELLPAPKETARASDVCETFTTIRRFHRACVMSSSTISPSKSAVPSIRRKISSA